MSALSRFPCANDMGPHFRRYVRHPDDSSRRRLGHDVSPGEPGSLVCPTNARCCTAGVISCLHQLASLHGGR